MNNMVLLVFIPILLFQQFPISHFFYSTLRYRKFTELSSFVIAFSYSFYRMFDFTDEEVYL